MIFRFGELFCGAGGLGLGAKQAKVYKSNIVYEIKHVWATDYDESACETYRHNILSDKPESVICRDIRDINFKELKEISEIDALAFGFPCNDFSIVGKQTGINGKYGSLYSYGVKALNYFQPKWFLAENVGGLKSANDGVAFQKILKELSEAGYFLYPHLYKFEEYGIPQTRHRIMIVGIRKDCNVTFKIPSIYPYSQIDISCKNALENPPIFATTANNELTKQSKQVVERLNYIKQGENAFTADLPSHLKLKVKGAKISQIYKRLEANKPAYTITGSGGGGTHVYHWSEPRALTNRERARLQTFPDDFIFLGKKESVRKQIGMAVSCSMAKIIFECVLNSFAHIKYPSIPSNIFPLHYEKESEKFNLVSD